jgi:leucyl-tRNA synthetase
MSEYNFKQIESKWQKFWLENKTFRTPGPGDNGFDESKPKYYVLDMFPYPSGSGLHVGHPKGYTATDITARYKRHLGYNVLHPMGWDAFGLPAEQYAIQTGTHPAETTASNVDNFRSQLQSLGFSYDWDREINTTHPEYYKWTQWVFKKLHEQGLAYEAEIPVWWCPALGTVLANEEVIDGHSERGGHPCEKRPLRQWMFKITAYAERLLADLKDLDWPDSVKAMQREWIGRSEGAEIRFNIEGHNSSFPVFTTRPETVYGVSFCVLSPEHPGLDDLVTEEYREQVNQYKEAAKAKSDLERAELQKEKTGVFTGAYALNPALPLDDPRSRIPIYTADYVLMSYGTGAIMCVPDGDDRDREFAQKYDLPIPNILDEDLNLVNSEHLNGLAKDEAIAQMLDWIEERNIGERKVNFRLRDWLFSRQRYWGEPFPILHEINNGERTGNIKLVEDSDLPVSLPALENFGPTDDGKPPLARAEEWVNVVDSDGKVYQRELNSMPQWAGSCWYYLRFLDPNNDEIAWSQEVEKYWMPVDLYVGGAEHAVLHLLYARFWHKVLFDCGLVSTSEPFQKLVNQGMVQSFAYKNERGVLVPADEAESEGENFNHIETKEPLTQLVAKMSKSLKNVINPDDVCEEYGADTLRLYEVFMGPITASAPWNPRDLPGVHRFLQRTWRAFDKGLSDASNKEIEQGLHKCIKKVGKDLENMSYNTAISAMMEFINLVTKSEHCLTHDQAGRFCVLLEPFAPHLAEEIYANTGGEELLSYLAWPSYDESLLHDDEIEIPVQVNGKLKLKVMVPAECSKEEQRDIAQEALGSDAGGDIKKVIVVPGRMVNFVV